MDGDRIRRVERRARAVLKPSETQFLSRTIRQYREDCSLRTLLIGIGRVLVKERTFGLLDHIRPIVLEQDLGWFDQEVFVWKQTGLPPGASSFSGDSPFLALTTGRDGDSNSLHSGLQGVGLIVVTIKKRRGEPLGFSIRPEGHCARVSTVIPNSAAFKAGLRVGDTVVAINRIRTSGLKYTTAKNVLQDAASEGKKLKVILRPLALAPNDPKSRSTDRQYERETQSSRQFLQDMPGRRSRSKSRSNSPAETIESGSMPRKAVPTRYSDAVVGSTWQTDKAQLNTGLHAVSGAGGVSERSATLASAAAAATAATHADGPIEYVTLRNPGRGNLGIRVSGGDVAGIPIVIDAVIPESSASRAGLRPGQEIIAVNGVNFCNMTRTEGSRVIESSPVLRFAVRNGAIVQTSASQQWSETHRPSINGQQSNCQHSTKPRPYDQYCRQPQPQLQAQSRFDRPHNSQLESQQVLYQSEPSKYGHQVRRSGWISKNSRSYELQSNALQPSKQPATASHDLTSASSHNTTRVPRKKVTMSSIRAMLEDAQTDVRKPAHHESQHVHRTSMPHRQQHSREAVPLSKAHQMPIKPHSTTKDTRRGSNLAQHSWRSTNISQRRARRITLPTIMDEEEPEPGLGDEMGSPIREDLFVETNALDESLYGFNNSFRASPVKQVVTNDNVEFGDSVVQHKICIDNQAGASSTDSYNSYDRWSNVKSAEARAPSTAPPPPPPPPSTAVDSMSTSTRPPLASVINMPAKSQSVTKSSLLGEIEGFKKKSLTRVRSPRNRSKARQAVSGIDSANSALLIALKTRLKACSSTPPSPMNASWD